MVSTIILHEDPTVLPQESWGLPMGIGIGSSLVYRLDSRQCDGGALQFVVI